MATTAERQAAYRKRRPEAGDNGERRINTWVSTETKLNLKRLAKRYGVTEREMLERLIEAEEKRTTVGMSEEEFEKYLLGVTA